MKIYKTLIGMATTLALINAFNIAQAAPQQTTRFLTLGSVVNSANGVVLEPQRLTLRNAVIINNCTGAADFLNIVNSSQPVTIRQHDPSEKFGFTYVYRNRDNSANTCTVVGSFKKDGTVETLTATSTGTGFTCSIPAGSKQKFGSQMSYLLDVD